jgi:hypothetical protein
MAESVLTSRAGREKEKDEGTGSAMSLEDMVPVTQKPST